VREIEEVADTVQLVQFIGEPQVTVEREQVRDWTNQWDDLRNNPKCERNYSWRSATMGSTCIARRAGM
jgi:hypothetical protein